MKQVLLIGAGNMGGALLRGWIENWHTGSASFHVIDPDPEAPARFPQARFYETADQLPADLLPDIVVVAVKPEKVIPILALIGMSFTSETCVVSVAAGVTIKQISAATLPDTPVVRIMPNIGATVGYSVSAGFAPAGVQDAIVETLDQMFSAIGQMTWVETEDNLHVVTALSGSGPAYYFAFCEAFRDAAVQQGLPVATAQRLAAGTCIAACRMLEYNPTHISQVRR